MNTAALPFTIFGLVVAAAVVVFAPQITRFADRFYGKSPRTQSKLRRARFFAIPGAVFVVVVSVLPLLTD